VTVVERLRHGVPDARAGGAGNRKLLDQIQRPEIHPRSGVERARNPVNQVHGGGPSAKRRAVFDVVDDQAPGVEDLDQRGE
jgi:hypothetical protein